MKIITTYISGLKISGRLMKMTVLIYCVNLSLSLIIAIPFLGDLKSGFGSSMLPDALLKGFDFTSISEFLRISSGVISSYIHQARWMIFLYFLLSILFSGGILVVIYKKEKFSVISFFNGCLIYFFRFFKLFIYMAVFNILIAVIVYLPLSIIIKSAADTVDSEATLFFIGMYGVIIHLILFGILQMVSYYAKIQIVSDDSRKVFRAIFKSMGFVFKHFINTFSLFLLLLVAPVSLWIAYFILRNSIGFTSGFTILIMFIIQQAFTFSRIFIRIWKYGSQYELYSKYKE